MPPIGNPFSVGTGGAFVSESERGDAHSVGSAGAVVSESSILGSGRFLSGHRYIRRMMRDRCQVYARTEGAQQGPYPGDLSFVPGFEIRCYLNLGKARQVFDGSQVTVTDGEVFLPLDAEVQSGDRIQVTRIRGKSVDPITYELLGNPSRSHLFQRGNLRQVTQAARF